MKRERSRCKVSAGVIDETTNEETHAASMPTRNSRVPTPMTTLASDHSNNEEEQQDVNLGLYPTTGDPSGLNSPSMNNKHRNFGNEEGPDDPTKGD